MNPPENPAGIRRFSRIITFSFFTVLVCCLQAQVPTADYNWKPVRLGAGGLVTGMSIHPLYPAVRFARTDVGNGYRWDANLGIWQPIIVRNVAATSGVDMSTGLSAEIAAVPAAAGVESLVVDPTNVNVVYIAFPLSRSHDVVATRPSSAGALYKSTDGGLTFAKTGLSVPMQPNGDSRGYGERIAIDPKNNSVVYYGSVSSGLRRSINGGADWSLVASGAPAANANVINILFDPVAPAMVVNGQIRTSIIYANTLHGETYRSADGGQTWSAISTGIDLSGCTGFATIDRDGRLYVILRPIGSYVNGSGQTVYYHYSSNQVWRYAEGSWTKIFVRDANGYGFGGYGNISHLTIDPNNPQRLFALSDGGALTRSTNGGASWVKLSDGFTYANTLAWLPQITANPYRSNCAIILDRDGRLWSAQGNEGVLTWKPSASDSDATDSNPAWTIDSKGIEELVAHEIVIPPGSGDKVVVTVEDATGFFIDNPDQFTARQAAELQPGQLISNGVGLAYCPNAPGYLVIAGPISTAPAPARTTPATAATEAAPGPPSLRGPSNYNADRSPSARGATGASAPITSSPFPPPANPRNTPKTADRPGCLPPVSRSMPMGIWPTVACSPLPCANTC